MKNYEDIKKLRKSMEKALDAKRYEHSLGVEFTAACMAMKYGCDIENARIAGILHDCAKCIPDSEKILLCEKNGIEISAVEKKKPALLHAKAGAFLAKTQYGIKNEDIINAIMYHTTGRPDMSLLEKIIFLSDYIEPNRKTIPGLLEAREACFNDINAAMAVVLKNVLEYLESGKGQIDDKTRETFDFYKVYLPKED